MTGVAKNTVIKLLLDLGVACEACQVGTRCTGRAEKIQCDEIPFFVVRKHKEVNPGRARG